MLTMEKNNTSFKENNRQEKYLYITEPKGDYGANITLGDSN